MAKPRFYSIRTEKSYVDWLQRFLIFHQSLKFESRDENHIAAFIEYLAINREVAPATPAAALNVIVFYFKIVRKIAVGDFSNFVKVKRRDKLPVVLTQQVVACMLSGFTACTT